MKSFTLLKWCRSVFRPHCCTVATESCELHCDIVLAAVDLTVGLARALALDRLRLDRQWTGQEAAGQTSGGRQILAGGGNKSGFPEKLLCRTAIRRWREAERWQPRAAPGQQQIHFNPLLNRKGSQAKTLLMILLQMFQREVLDWFLIHDIEPTANQLGVGAVG